MYLIVFRDGTSKQIRDNLTTGDIITSLSNHMFIFRLKKKRFEKLIQDQGKISWVPVHDAKVSGINDFRIHY